MEGRFPMRINRWLLAAAVVLALGLPVVLYSNSRLRAAPVEQRVAWEYRQEWETNRGDDEKMLSAAGSEGWDLVAAGMDRTGAMRFIFKRPSIGGRPLIPAR